MIASNNSKNIPLLQNLFFLPLRIVPVTVHSTALAFTINRIFARQIQNGELNFLIDRVITIDIHDANLIFCLTLKNGQLVAANKTNSDLKISGSMYDFLLLATGREDPDTLFFQRRLSLDGDTELGLYVKNFLNSQDPKEVLPAPLQLILPYLLPIYIHIFVSDKSS